MALKKKAVAFNSKHPGKTSSPYTLGQRRRMAFRAFAQGSTAADVARKLHVTEHTAESYKQMWKKQFSEEAAKNPYLLRDVVNNTMQALEELDLIRKEAWKQYNRQTTPGAKSAFMGHMLKAQADRARLYGLFGVKAEYMAQIQAVRVFQVALLNFMRDELCEVDREKLAHLIETQFGHMIEEEMQQIAPIESERVEDGSGL